MTSEWQTGRLGDFADVQTGPFGSQLHKKDYVDIGTPIITVEHLGDNRIVHSNLPRVSEKDRLRLKKYWMREGDIIFSRVGSVDRRAFVYKQEDGWLFSGRCLRVRVTNKDLNSRFLSFFLGLESVKEHIRQIAVGATMPSLNTALLSNVEIIVPPLPEQRAIAHILGTLDDKIELNRRMNETLAAMAQTVFKSWFINFDPVIDNALAAGNPIPEAIQPRAKIRRSILNGTAERNGYESLSDTIRQRFPSAFEYTEEIGYIPKGWKVGVLDDMIELLSGGTPRTSVAQYWDGNIPWYTAKDAPSLSDIFVIETERKITQAGVENSATKILPAGTTIITARGTVGRLACLGIPMAMNQTCYGIRGTDSYPDYFTYLNIRMTVAELQQRTHGTIFDTITRHTFQLVDTIIPPPKLADTFETVVQPIMNRILSNLQESRTLTAVRDTLLSKLIAGDLRVERRLP